MKQARDILLLTPVAYSLLDEVGRVRLFVLAVGWGRAVAARPPGLINGRSRA
jgi:hypothetical protein